MTWDSWFGVLIMQLLLLQLQFPSLRFACTIAIYGTFVARVGQPLRVLGPEALARRVGHAHAAAQQLLRVRAAHASALEAIKRRLVRTGGGHVGACGVQAAGVSSHSRGRDKRKVALRRSALCRQLPAAWVWSLAQTTTRQVVACVVVCSYPRKPWLDRRG